MESQRRVPAASPATATEAEPQDDKSRKERADREIAERLSNPPEVPTPTQAEADALKEGVVEGVTREQRDVKPGPAASGYQTR